ncbi:acetylajmaline esterase [Sarracenia purpurea var. burkii]
MILFDCANYFKKSLFLVGEIGGNDYNYPFFAGESFQQLQALVSPVVEAIAAATSVLIEEGASALVVPGNLPIGCSTVYLTLFRSANKSDYDQDGCLKAYNAFAKYHNAQLKLALDKLKPKYPHATIIYADYYGAAKGLFDAPLRHEQAHDLGFWLVDHDADLRLEENKYGGAGGEAASRKQWSKTRSRDRRLRSWCASDDLEVLIVGERRRNQGDFSGKTSKEIEEEGAELRGIFGEASGKLGFRTKRKFGFAVEKTRVSDNYPVWLCSLETRVINCLGLE